MEHAVVALIVAVAFVYAAWKVVPQALRSLVARGAARLCTRAGWSESRAATMSKRLASTSCGACDSCGGCAVPPTEGTIPLVPRR